ncbi:hypothetical protein [uncultured Gemmobacter sp.]|uniref:hypothetical protein n=1 Tax=uncultured Gemmobacter sp. TaxID=1095917 RepID=UPI000A9F08F5|nr:hypothetical protein [uncultured Gemmobacter sp.]
MGYSSPKKQLDLKEFLSTPATKRPSAKGFGFRKYRFPKDAMPETTPDTPDADGKES